MPDFQFMPDHTPEALAALKADIAEHGVQVPVVTDQHGRVLDGNNRVAIASELGIDYPVEVIEVTDDADAEDRAIALNLVRRHVSRAQMRELIQDQLDRHPEMSDRAIAKRLGTSHPTVASVRRGGKSFHHDPALLEEARLRGQKLVDEVDELRVAFAEIAASLAANGVESVRIVRALRDGQRLMENSVHEVWVHFGRHIYEPLVDWVLDEEFAEEFASVRESADSSRLSEEAIERLLQTLTQPLGTIDLKEDNA